MRPKSKNQEPNAKTQHLIMLYKTSHSQIWALLGSLAQARGGEGWGKLHAVDKVCHAGNYGQVYYSIRHKNEKPLFQNAPPFQLYKPFPYPALPICCMGVSDYLLIFLLLNICILFKETWLIPSPRLACCYSPAVFSEVVKISSRVRYKI